jgi:hypothetical protein
MRDTVIPNNRGFSEPNALPEARALVDLALLPLMAYVLLYSFLHKQNMKLHSEFVLWTQLVRGTGFWF